MSPCSHLWGLECKNRVSVFLCICVFIRIYMCIWCVFNSLFFEEKWQYSAAKANIVNSLVYIISAVASPFLGFAVDRTGFNVMWGE